MEAVNNFIFLRCKNDEKNFLNEFLKDIRKEEREEILILTNDIYKELNESIKNSTIAIKVLSKDNKPLCIYGTKKIKGIEGNLIWCVGTNEMMKYKKSFVKISKHILEKWKKQYGILYNCISVENKKSFIWLKMLGAEFSEPFLVANNKYFRRFILKG